MALVTKRPQAGYNAVACPLCKRMKPRGHGNALIPLTLTRLAEIRHNGADVPVVCSGRNWARERHSFVVRFEPPPTPAIAEGWDMGAVRRIHGIISG